jgi:hypothetical protein
MNTIEIEQLKNYLEVKIGILAMRINNGKIQNETSLELVNSFKEYEKDGLTIEELNLLVEDVELALS